MANDNNVTSTTSTQTQEQNTTNAQVFEDTEVAEENKKRKKRGYKKKEPSFQIIVKNARPETLEEAEAKQEMYGIVRINNRISTTKRVMLIVLAALFLFVAGSYLIYYYTEIADLRMATLTHVHEYHENGNYINGDCQTYGYTEHICKYPGCNSKNVTYDTEYGPHRFKKEDIKQVEENGKIYFVYTCIVCQKEIKTDKINLNLDPQAITNVNLIIERNYL